MRNVARPARGRNRVSHNVRSVELAAGRRAEQAVERLEALNRNADNDAPGPDRDAAKATVDTAVIEAKRACAHHRAILQMCAAAELGVSAAGLEGLRATEAIAVLALRALGPRSARSRPRAPRRRRSAASKRRAKADSGGDDVPPEPPYPEPREYAADRRRP
jgi:hypothetical protein